jgi:hypothetical protein
MLHRRQKQIWSILLTWETDHYAIAGGLAVVPPPEGFDCRRCQLDLIFD